MLPCRDWIYMQVNAHRSGEKNKFKCKFFIMEYVKRGKHQEQILTERAMPVTRIALR